MTTLSTDLQKKYKLSHLMVVELKRIARFRCVRGGNASIRALKRRGFVFFDNDNPCKEGWTLTEEGEVIARQL